MKTPREPVSAVQVNYACDKALADPDALLDRYFTLTGWSDALAAAGAGRVAVVQRFHRDARITRNGIEYIFAARRLAETVADRRPDIAHVNGLIFPAETWMLRRALDRSCAVVVQSHSDGGAIGRAPLFRLLGRAARGAADAFLFAADEHAVSWRQAGFIAPDQLAYQVMEASTRLQPVARGAAQEASGVRGSPAVLWVGRLNANKDPLTVLDGFERSLGDLPGATLTMIYSEDDLLAAVRQRVQRSGMLSDRVRLIGAVPHDRMAFFYSAADLFIVGSHHEGSGYSLMEACACGAMPVVTGVPTFRLLTGGGTLGALWTPGDADDCARALVDVGRRDLNAERARLALHFERELSWGAVGRQALAIYESVATRRRAGIRARAAGNLSYFARKVPLMSSTVLVVDDDPNLVRLMSKFLKLEGFAPVPAANGREALEYLRGGGGAQVILLDLRMPVMDGWAFRREQRADPELADIPIVVLSGVEPENIGELAAAAAFNKPVSFPAVVVAVRRLCEDPR